MREPSDTELWTTVIKPETGLLDFNLKELLSYKFLMFLFVRRDFVSQFKQTILGPLWFVVQPLFTTGIYTIIFGNLAKIPTEGVPQPVFYMAGITLWGFFSGCLSGTSAALIGNVGIFGKVYFPRLTVPITTVATKFLTFLLQMALFLIVYLAYMLRGAVMAPNLWLLLLPALLLQSAALGLAFGLCASALTVKYRDLSQLVAFGLSIWMWATPHCLSLIFGS